jgi:hypothetical protein
MELKLVSDDAYNQLMKKLEEIKKYLDENYKKNPLDEIWLDNQEVCRLLKISKRTLQTYRDRHMIPYSQVVGKIYFKASDIQKHLLDNYQ